MFYSYVRELKVQNVIRYVALEFINTQELVNRVENVCAFGDGLDQMQHTQLTIRFWQTIVVFHVTILTTIATQNVWILITLNRNAVCQHLLIRQSRVILDVEILRIMDVGYALAMVDVCVGGVGLVPKLVTLKVERITIE